MSFVFAWFWGFGGCAFVSACTACGILFLPLRTELSKPWVVRTRSPNHWTTRESPIINILINLFWPKVLNLLTQTFYTYQNFLFFLLENMI